MANEQKTPIARTLPQFATQVARNQIASSGLALPGHVIAIEGSIVTVNFDVTDVQLPQVMMPVFGPEYIRYPIQVGDKGVAFPVNVSIAEISGLGATSAAPSFKTRPGNLGALVWFPIANRDWLDVDPQALVLYAPNGIVLRDVGNTASVHITPANVTITVGVHTIVVTSAGITIGTTGGTDVTINGHSFLNHQHIGVQTGTGVSGGVNPTGP
jgi:hypothetical protein